MMLRSAVWDNIAPSLLSGMIVCSLMVTITASDEYNGAIECYFCIGDAFNSTCAKPTPADLAFPEKAGIYKDECKRGTCVKLVKANLEGQMLIERTCSHRIPNFRIIMADVCRYESNGNGYICMCGRDFCNHGDRMTTSGVFLATVLLGQLLWTMREHF